MPAERSDGALNDVLDPMQIEALNTDVDELDITDTDESSISVLLIDRM